MFFLRLFALLLVASSTALAQGIDDVVEVTPDALQPWVDWVLAEHPELSCPIVNGSATCLWPGELELDIHPEKGSFTLSVEANRTMPLALPGGSEAWPQGVKTDGKVAVVLDIDGVPTVKLEEGRHKITGGWTWARRPQSLPVPPLVARLALSVDGQDVDFPAIDSEGSVRLGAGDAREAGEERLDIEVSRRVEDGVPVRITTQVDLRAAGRGREVDLGVAVLPGTRPVWLEADLPARFDDAGHLHVQVRAGSYTVSFHALHEGPVATLARPETGEPWPDVETWAVATDDRARAVNVGGPPSVDPARTSLPVEWHGLATFLVSPSDTLAFEELRRGEPEAAPNQLDLRRELWLDHDGSGLTARDKFTGTMNQGWRLSMTAPGQLGHVAQSGEDQVITEADAGQGVALREATVNLLAESRLPAASGELPAVGWQTDVQSLEATLHLPPGWALLTATGVDTVTGSVVEDWSLFDIFFVLIVALAAGRVLGPKWGAVALIGLALARHETGAPQWIWVILLVVLALERALGEGMAAKVARTSRLCLLALLALILLPFAKGQVEQGLFPALESPSNTTGDSRDDFGGTAVHQDHDFQQVNQPEPLMQAIGGSADDIAQDISVASSSTLRGRNNKRQEVWIQSEKKAKKGGYLTMQLDPTAVVQTGPGVPRWTWSSPSLEWSGPVTADQHLRLYLLSPLMLLGLALGRVALLLALGLRFARRLQPVALPRSGSALAGLVFLGLLGPPTAHAEPSVGVLKDLETRLTAPATCAPDCLEVPRLTVRALADRLIIEAEVHAGAATAWPVPGPTDEWVPRTVTVDGSKTQALARLSNGFLHVRLDAGVHRVRVEGSLPPTDALSLRFGEDPHQVVFDGKGWELGGLKADGTAAPAVQLSRVADAEAGEAAGVTRSSEHLSPWLEVHRYLDLGIPWAVRTTVTRRGPTERPVSVAVPILPGEAVTTHGFEVKEGAVQVTLDRDQEEASWESTLAQTERLRLEAPSGVAWSERWTLSCSPVFSCKPLAADALTAMQHTQEDRWLPEWQPWPGEVLEIVVRRPEAVAGQTLTIDRAKLELTPGRRLTEAVLSLDMKASQGGQQAVQLPAGATLIEARIDGTVRPIQMQGDAVPVPVKPGSQQVELEWQITHDHGLVDVVPAVDLGAPAVNVTVTVEHPSDRWLIATWGPRWGPVPLMWTTITIMIIAAPLLGRLWISPLRTWQWLLLGLGMTQLPILAAGIVAGWLLALGWRRHRPPESTWAFNLAQIGLVALTGVALLCLYLAIHAGLLFQPDAQIAGNGSTGRSLSWFTDRTTGPLPQPTVVSAPMWSWRLVMLAWSLWLAASLVRWLPMGWRAWSQGGRWRMGGGSTPAQTPPSSPPPATSREEASTEELVLPLEDFGGPSDGDGDTSGEDQSPLGKSPSRADTADEAEEVPPRPREPTSAPAPKAPPRGPRSSPADPTDLPEPMLPPMRTPLVEPLPNAEKNGGATTPVRGIPDHDDDADGAG